MYASIALSSTAFSQDISLARRIIRSVIAPTRFDSMFKIGVLTLASIAARPQTFTPNAKALDGDIAFAVSVISFNNRMTSTGGFSFGCDFICSTYADFSFTDASNKRFVSSALNVISNSASSSWETASYIRSYSRAPSPATSTFDKSAFFPVAASASRRASFNMLRRLYAFSARTTAFAVLSAIRRR